MCAIVRTSEGAALRVRPRPPLPREPGWARVRLLVAGLCRTDVYAARGQLPCAVDRVLGHEAAGRIVGLSAGTDPSAAHAEAFERGTLVAFHPFLGCGVCPSCASSRPQHCPNARMLGVAVDGVFAEEAVVPLRACVPLPGVGDPRVAAFLEPYAAALAVAHAGLAPHARTLLVGEGRIATLTEFVLRRAGFTDVTCAIAPPAGERFDLGIETRVGPGGVAALVDALRPAGTLVLKSRPARPLAVDVARWVQRDLTVRAVSYAPFERAAEELADPSVDVGAWLGEVHSYERFHALLTRGAADARGRVVGESASKPLLACDGRACAA